MVFVYFYFYFLAGNTGLYNSPGHLGVTCAFFVLPK